eukprot:COSAG01_NODE_229_length_21089_cov_575.019194_22_plen_58_part_00
MTAKTDLTDGTTSARTYMLRRQTAVNHTSSQRRGTPGTTPTARVRRKMMGLITRRTG